MQNFFRSLRFLWPYRLRLGISLLCVILIAVLWGGGLGMILPGSKVLLSREGLHGWAWQSIVEDKLGVTVVERLVPAQVAIETSLVIEVVEVTKGSPAQKAGIRKNDWIIGLEGGPEAHRTLRGDILSRQMAKMDSSGPIRLRVLDPHAPQGDAYHVRTVTPDEIGLGSKILRRIAETVPEPKSFRDRFEVFAWLLMIALGITFLRNILRFVQEYLTQTAVYHGTMDLRCETYDNVLRLPTTFFSEQGVSDTMSRFIQDTGELANGQVTLLGKTLVEPAKAAASITVAMFFSWQLTLLALIAGPPVYFLVRQFGRIMKHVSRRALESSALLLGVLEETLTGIRVVKAYTMEGTERRRFHRVHRTLFKQQRRMARIDSATAPAVEALGLTAAMAAAALAGWWVFNHQMKVDNFLAMMGCLAAMFDPVRKLAKVATRFQRAEAAATRIFELHDREQEKRLPGAPPLPPHRQGIEYRNVSFRYPSGIVDAVRDVSLTVRYGETVAIVGPNGCGKTTLMSMLPRLIDPTRGGIFIDDRDITTHSLRDLRQQIGLVTQETVIFHATIGENISYGLRRPHHEAMLSAARKAYVDEFVRELPDGYETMVGERGATLSGGQRQRIAIARAILRDPAILIFDEATSQIDADSEHRIHQAMQEFVQGRTTLLIAHRFATVLSADRIIVMGAGQVIDIGRHEELLARCGLYAHLYRTQFADTAGQAT